MTSTQVVKTSVGQQQFFPELPSRRRSHKTNYWYSLFKPFNIFQSSLYECRLKEVYGASKMLIKEQNHRKINVRYTQTLGLIIIITNMITFTIVIRGITMHLQNENIRIQLKAVLVVDHHFLHSLYTFDVDVIHISNQSLNLKNRKCQYLIYTEMQFVSVFNERLRENIDSNQWYNRTLDTLTIRSCDFPHP